MKRLSFWLILSGLSLCLLAGCGQKTQHLPVLPEDHPVELSICFENQYSERNLYSKEEVQALNDLLAQASAQPVEDWTAPEDLWPIYGLYAWGDSVGDGSELNAACFGNLWVDNQGHAFRVKGLDLQALTDIFPDGWEQKEGSYIPFRRALALCGGRWNERFLTPSDLPPLWTDVSMTLDNLSEGLSWTLTNLGQRQLFHGNGGHADLQVCLEDAWYYVPIQFGYFVTDEGITLPPGGSYSYTSSLDAYGDLPPGRYRIVFSVYLDRPSLAEEGYSAVSFLIQEDGTFTQESLC